MTLVSAITITPIDADQVTVAWTAPAASNLSWVFVNGFLAAGSLAFSTAARSTPINFPTDETAVIEIHDLAADGVVAESFIVQPNRRPKIKWAGISSAARYRVYQRATPDGTDERLHDGPADATRTRFELVTPQRLDGQGGVWHFLRVESVDNAGNESERISFPYRVMEPPAPVTLEVAAGSGAGLFDLSIGA